MVVTVVTIVTIVMVVAVVFRVRQTPLHRVPVVGLKYLLHKEKNPCHSTLVSSPF